MVEQRITRDYHIHTKLCKHAKGEMFEYVETAIEKGLTEIAFTDHIPLPDGFDAAHRMAESDLEKYVKSIEDLRRQYPQIKIRCGIEADFYDGFEDYLQKTFARYAFEIIIMSVHYVKGWPKNNWAFSFYFPDCSLTAVYSDYLQAVRRGVETGLFNVLGHLDLIKRPEQSLLEQNRAEVEEILESCARFNMAVELNTSGLRKEIGQVYPDLSFMPLVKEAGLPICFGSDAHEPWQVGYRFEDTDNALKAFPNLTIKTF